MYKRQPLTCENVDPAYEPGSDYAGGPVKLQGRQYDRAVGAEPANPEKEAVIYLDLTGLSALRFRSVIGGDYPVGEESGRRRTIAVRQHGKKASWITVLEPVEKEHLIKRVKAESAEQLEVSLKDGRTIVIQIGGLMEREAKLRVLPCCGSLYQPPLTHSHRIPVFSL